MDSMTRPNHVVRCHTHFLCQQSKGRRRCEHAGLFVSIVALYPPLAVLGCPRLAWMAFRNLLARIGVLIGTAAC